MQDVVKQILEGNVENENGSLDFSCQKIEIVLQKGMDYEGSFRIFAPGGGYSVGYVYSSDYRMECLTEEFTGSECEILYRFHGNDSEEGDVVKGSFYIISNHGEYYLPFVVSAEHSVLDSSVGPIKNLFHFANLAKSNWQEALKLFYSPEFAGVFTGSDAQYYESYLGLSVYPGQEQNMEEFLIQINKKQQVEYLVEESEISFSMLKQEITDEAIMKEISILRNGWGYTNLNVDCDGDFLFIQKDMINDDDFIGNRVKLPVYIDSTRLREGSNYGKVLFYNSYVSFSVAVRINMEETMFRDRAAFERKRNIVEIMLSYQDFRMKRLNTAEWMKRNNITVEKMMVADEADVLARLFRVQMLITEERYNEAEWMLNHCKELLEKQAEKENRDEYVLWAYYLYLTTLMNPEESYINRVTTEVEKIYRKHSERWQLAWLLLYLSPEYSKSAIARWQFLEKQFDLGCRSFVIYIEALLLLNSNPTLLRQLGSFELQILYYGVRQNLLNLEVVEQLLYLCGKSRERGEVLPKILMGLYEKKPDSRILQELCTLFVKEAKTGKKYLEWYKKGIDSSLRIINLYEYFMLSINTDEKQEIPKAVLMYFTYQNNLDYEHLAYLYDYLMDNRALYPDLYDTYLPKIEQFVAEQIQKERIDRHLSNLYSHMLTGEYINEENAPALSKLLFANRICVNDSRLRKVIVYHPGCRVPMEYPLYNGETWVSLYGNDYTILFEDAFHNRFVKNVEYDMEKLMIPGKHLKQLSGFVQDIPELNLYLIRNERGLDDMTGTQRTRAMFLAENDMVAEKLRHEYLFALLKNCFAEDRMEELDGYLTDMDWNAFGASERAEIVKYMVLRGMKEQAYEMVCQHSPYFVDPAILLRLISAKTEEIQEEDPVLLASCYYVFERGKYNAAVLQYLNRYFKGMTKHIRDIWKASKDFGTDCYYLAERFLVQMLFSGAYVGEKMEIFRYYVNQGAKPEIEAAFLVQCCHDYFAKDKLTDSFVFQQISFLERQEEALQLVCKLSFLKYCSENVDELTDSMKEIMVRYLKEMLEKRIHLNFFRGLPGVEDYLWELRDKTIIEYNVKPGAKARIHYVILREDGESEEYLAEYMRDIYGGVCVKEFVLFFGETLQYYITEEYGEEEQLTESGELQKNDIGVENHGDRYDLINDLVISKSLQDYDTFDTTLEHYYRLECYNEQLFRIR